ncbi:hypothetical protein ADL22_08585 [Streptomyces sp. NRRL F-4489]|uniref:hypothetical protein n=1 Tax=Streptomyces sp. NRRL F-4489 TaxID=1609095 RepID=UPI000746A5ED|nr:hypothetical protein [Streptomyces sp. NRRL F-4489]KUL49198.1 hypothetical protein ADL22_08585 [Streptomyces sp. NRRL F-4489]
MHGPVPAPPPYRPPARGTVLALRVVFVAATVLSLGFLAWTAMLRAAIVMRRPLGWWLFAGQTALFIGTGVLITSFPEDDWRTNAGVGLLLLQIAGVVAYYLVTDLRAERARDRAPFPVYPGAAPHAPMAPGPAPMAPGPALPPYGPPPVHPHPPLHAQETQPFAVPGHPGAPAAGPYATTAPGTPPPPAPYGHPAPPPGVPAPPPERRPQPQRIDRVRAELDELSDYLRKEEGR